MKGLRPAGLLLVLLPVIAACSGKKAGDDTAAASTSSPAGAAGNASTNKLCALYSTSEIKDVLGTAVKDGEAAGPMATACQWDGTNPGADPVFVQVQMIPGKDYWEKHSGAQGYEELPGIGKEAFVATSMGGWEAATVTDKAVLFVTLNGGTASRNSAVAFLKKTMEKLGPAI